MIRTVPGLLSLRLRSLCCWRVDQQRREIRDIETQFAKLKKTTDDASERMAKFMAEKRRIDSLENDYSRLMTMSQAVELKLEHVTASNDTLQAMQASLRNVEELEKDVEGRFQRLEKKKAILDLTTEVLRAQQELNRSKVACFFVDESCFSPSK